MAVTNLAEQEKLRKEAEERQKRRYERSQGKNNNEAKAITRTYKKQDPDAPINNGGFWGGVGYLGEKLAAGTVQSIEGMVDYIVGGVQKAIGDATGNIDMQDAAYDTFNTQWWNGDFYRHADEWYNPSGEMKVAGDVAGGIGTSLPAIGTAAAITALSHGAAAPWAVGLASGVAGLGAAGNATSEAVQQTGSLDWSKIGYGALVGATEAGIEYATVGIGAGTGRIIKNIAQSSVGKAASQLTRRGLFNIAKEIGKDFASEAAEEAIAEIMAPVYARMTYNPDAQFATPEQVWYAAFVGGMSGILMGGAGNTFSAAKSRVIGGNIAKNQTEVDKVLRSARQIAEFYEQSGVESETMKSISAKLKSLEASMAKSGNAVGNALRSEHQKKLLGDLAQLNTAAAFETYAAQRAYDIVQNIDAFVEKASAYKYTDPEGNPITVSKEALLKGVKMDKNGNINRKSLIKAIRENRDLQYFALMDVAGRMQMDTAAFTNASMEGVTGANDLDLARYLEQASPEQKAQLASALGYETLDAVSADDFNARVAEYAGSAKYQNAKRIMETSEARRNDKADGKIPKRFAKTKDGTYVFESDGTKIAVTKEGDTYSVYDYTTEEAATDLSKTELNRMLGKYSETHAIKHSAETTTATETTEAKSKAKKTDADVTADVEAFASERVKGYSKLLPAEKTLVRRVIRQGKTLGVADDILTAYANVCAHAKVLVQFKRGIGAKNAQGKFVESNGYYDPARNVIVANPNATNGVGRVLIHELDHAIRSGESKRGKAGKAKTFSEAIKGVAEDVKANIKATYGKDVETIKDETNAYYAETVLSAEATVERLVADRPSLKDKILGFFSKAKTDYKDVPFLDKAAESYYRKYKKMFDKFAKRNAGGLVSAVSEGKFKAIRPSNELGRKQSLPLDEATFKAELEDWIDNTTNEERARSGERFDLGRTSDVLKSIDVRGTTIYFGASKINKILNENASMTVGTISKVVNLLRDPVLIMESITVEDSIIIFGEVYTTSEKPVMISLLVNPKNKNGEILDYATVTSAYGRRKSNLQNLINNSRIYYVAENKKRTDKWLKALGLQLPSALTKYGPIDSIIKNPPKVKSPEQNSRKNSLPLTDSEGKKLSAEQQKFFSESKQVDAEGRLQVMYQGAAEEFYSFDKKKSKASNLYGRGFYFTNSADQARNYGNVRPYYLNITTPLSTTERTISRLQMRKFLKAVAENEDYSIENYGTYDVEEVLKSVYGKDDFAMLYDVSLTAVGDLVEAVELFNEVNGTKYDGFILDTESVIFKSEQAKLTSNKAPTLNKDIRYSLPLNSESITEEDLEKARSEKEALQKQALEAKKKADSLKDAGRESAIMDLISADAPKNELNAALSEYKKWQEESGYKAAYDAYNDLEKQLRELRSREEQIESALSKQLLARKYTEEEKAAYATKAARKFRTTSRLSLAGYLTTNGSMLDFSQRQGYRVQDHRAISEILDLPEYAGYSDGMILFMNMGNIRLQTYGIDIAAMPNAKQITVLRSIIPEVMRENDEFIVDFSTKQGYTDGSITYPRGIATARIISDIKSYFEAGVLPEEPSNLSQFRKYSLPLSSHAKAAVAEFDTTTDFRKAGFVLPDGRMLHFERNGGVRHDRIAEVYDGVKGDAAVNAFIQEGNVRIKATAPGIELSSEHMPTVPQRNALNRFISRMLREKGRFYVDITDVNGRDVNTFEYDSEATAEDVMWDLRGYYGAEYTEDPAGVKNSLPLTETDRAYMDAVEKGDMETAKKMVYEAAEKAMPNSLVRDKSGDLLLVYHGSASKFTKFLHSKMNLHGNYHGRGFYFTENKDLAESYAKEGGQLLGGFLNIESTLSEEKVTIKKPDLVKLIKETCQQQAKSLVEEEGYDNLREALRDTWVSNYVDTYSMDINSAYREVANIIYSSADSDVDIVAELTNAGAGNEATLTLVRKFFGKDGVIYKNDLGTHEFVALTSNQFKSADPVTYANDGSIIPLSQRFNKSDPDIRYSLPLDTITDSTFDPRAALDKGTPRRAGKANMTVAQLSKVIANNTKKKVYSKKEALRLINNLSASDLVTAKTRNELATEVWALLNQAPDPDYREQSIRQVAEFIAAKFMTEAKYDNRDPAAVEEASYVSSNLHTYVGRIDFGSFAEEIKAMVGEDGWKAIRARWSFKKRNKLSTPMDVMMWDVVSEVKGFEGLAEMHPAEAFVEIDKRYTAALSALKKDDITLWETMDDAKARAVVDGIARDIRDAFMSGGNKSKLANILDNNIGYYKARIEEMVKEKTYKTETDKVKKLAERLKKVEMGALDNATQASNHNLKAPMKALADEMLKTEFSPEEVRAALTEFGYWYRSDETKRILGFKSYEDPGLYSPHIVDLFDFVLRSLPRETAEIRDTTPLSINDVKAIQTIMSHAIAISENYNKVWKNGKLVDALPEAKKYIETMHDTLAVKTMGAISKLFQAYRASFNDPKAYMRYADKYMDGGFFTETFESIRAASDSAAVAEMDLLKELDAFNDEHRSYVRETSEQKVKFRGQEIPKQTLITVYMTTKREHSWAGLALNGYQYRVGNAEFRLNPFTTAEELTYGEMQAVIGQAQSEMEQLLTDVDKQYIAILEKGYLRAKDIKAKRDMARLGFTNAIEGYYVPLKRANMATTIDQQFLPINTASNSSFNKNTVRGAAQSLEILPADDLFRRHIHEVCQYAYLSPAIESFDVLWNLDTSGNRNNPRSLKTVYHSVNAAADIDAKGFRAEVRKRLDMELYFRDLIQDVQGTKRGKESPVISKMRGAYAVAGLGLNPKVWITQLSSLGASLSVLDAKSLASVIPTAKRLGFGKDVDLYCRLAEHRNYSNTAASAQAVMDLKTGKANEGFERFKEFVMHPIGKMDRFVVVMEFVACQNYIASHNAGNPDLALGTEQNKIEAGKLLTEVIHNTQQGSLATEKSAASRGGETEKLFTMFRSDQIKVDSRVISSFEEMLVKARAYRVMKNNPGKYSAEQINSAKKRCKAASKQFGKSMAALLTTATIMALVARWFRFRRNKEDENEWLKMLGEFIGNLFGGLPIFTDIYSYFVEGYDIDNFALSAINDLLGSISNISTTIRKATEGTATLQDWMGGIKSVLFSFANFTGVPVRNVYNEITGWIRRISSGAGKKIDNVFYGTYASEFKEAIDRNDMSKAYAIIEILAGESLDGAESAVVDGFYDLNQRLLKQGKDIILPADCPASITVDGKKVEFTTAQQAKIQGRFAAKAEKDFKRLFASDAYKGMTALQKKAAVKAINDMRMHEAMEDVTNKNIGDTNVYLAQVVSASVYAQYKGVIYGIESDKDKNGKTISGSKRKKVIAAINRLSISKEQKLVLILAAGYTIESGDIIGVSAGAGKKKALAQIVNCTSLSEAERVALADKLGFEVVNGKIKG